MTEVQVNKKRLMIMLTVSVLSGVVAIGAMFGAITLRQDWLLAVFALALVVGFGGQIWFIVGLGRTKKGV